MKLNTPVFIGNTSSIAGPMEAKTKFAQGIDIKMDEAIYGEKCWDSAEEKMIKACLDNYVSKYENPDLIVSGELSNQLSATNNVMKNFDVPHLGVFSACSTFTESIIIGSQFVPYYNSMLVGSSSYFYTVEKQFRTPIEYGAQRKLTTQVTVTGAGFIELKKAGEIVVTDVFIGKVLNSGIDDACNMGAAMAPAAEDTIKQALAIGADFDAIITGDLGILGSEFLKELIKLDNHIDAGAEFFKDCDDYDVHQGASGPACIALYFISDILPKLKSGEYKKILLVATGCLISQCTAIKKQVIPVVAHGVVIERMA